MTRTARRTAMTAAAAVAVLFALGTPGCATISYYSQAIGGHLEVTRLAAPVEDRMRDESTPAALKAQLERAAAIRDFASRVLGLPDNGSYRRYADLGRPYVVWNVFAAPAYEMRAQESCYPFAGCVAYRGYYAKDDAEQYAASLGRAGYDVFVAGVPAYSTLGWFDDPLLNTFIRYPAPELARLVFHELAHQVVYVKDDTTFNESFAVTVEREGVRLWLDAHGSADDRAREAQWGAMRRSVGALLATYRERLDAHYRASTDPEAKRTGKSLLLAEMVQEYQSLKRDREGLSGFDRYFATPNNAVLVSISTYTQLVPAFDRLLAQLQGDLPRFYAAVRALARLSKPERDTALARLTQG